MNSKVFISYGKEDADSAKRLYSDLKSAGFDPWLDSESLLGGENWAVEISNAIQKARYFIALLSSTSVNRRGFVNQEISEALDVLKKYPESDIYLIPVRLDDCKPNHEYLKKLHWINLFPKWDEGLRNILKSLGYPQDRKPDSSAKAFVQVRLNPGNIDRAKIQDFVTDIPNVSQADVVLGRYDLCLTINAGDIESLQDTVSKIAKLPLVDSTETSISTGTIQGVNIQHVTGPDSGEAPRPHR